MSNNIFFERGQMADKPNNYLWNGDCLEVMKEIPSKSIDAIICDLPYGTTACKWDSIIPFEPLWEQYKRVIKDNGAIVLFGSEPFSSALRMSNIKMYKYDWIWKKTKGGAFALCNKMPLKRHEIISVFYKKLPTYNPQKTKAPEHLIDKRKTINNSNTKADHTYKGLKPIRKKDDGLRYPITVQEFNSEWSKGMHPTQKPLELIKYLVKTYTKENEWVLDNTCGSNTTGIACYDLNRNYIGIEKDIDIYNVAKKRVKENILLRANEQQTLFKEKP